MNKDIKLLVLDIDGTIAGKSNNLSPRVKEAIAATQAKGIQVAIATGRMYRSALRFYQQIDSQLPLIAYQGAWIQDPNTGKVHRHVPIKREIAWELLNYFEKPQWQWDLPLSVHFYINDELYVREITKETQDYGDRSNITPIAVGDLRKTLQEPTKILALCDDANLIQKLLENVRQHYSTEELYITTSVPTFFEATNPQVNKGIGVRYLAEDLMGLDRNNVMAIGDNFNDLEMLEYGGIGVAMGEAPEDVKQIADWVTTGVEEDGAAVAIEKFLLS
jgi:Cof subfamily protein (haloacid dehalogenase superfamily)